ncbi:MAG: hypothetical protein J6O04_03900 [Selenomonadaceae bacterium]|nr:hypothetical protein [Selenomonadaceae bacterium]
MLPILGKILKEAIPFIVGGIGKLIDKFVDNIGNAPSVNDKTDVNDVEQIMEALGGLRKEVLKNSEPIMRQAAEEVESYIDEQLFNLDDKAELLARYNISPAATAKKLKRIGLKAEKFWQDAMYRKISIDNAECRSVLSLPPGGKKEAELQKFTQKVVTESLTEYTNLLKDEMYGIYDDLEYEILKATKELETKANIQNELVLSLEAKDDDKFEEIVANALVKVSCCDIVREKVGAA